MTAAAVRFWRWSRVSRRDQGGCEPEGVRTDLAAAGGPTHRPNRWAAFWRFEHAHVQEAEPLVQRRATLAAGLDVGR